MPEGGGPEESQSGAPQASESTGDEQIRPLVTRRDFIVGAGTGAVVVGVVAGAGVAASRAGQTATAPAPVAGAGPGGPAVAAPPVAPAPAAPAAPATPAAAPAAAPAAPTLPLTMRAVTLNVDGLQRSVTVDTRESLWETMTHSLNMASSNLGCDRAQCGACAVVVDGRAVNGCSVLTARLGRGQQILTVASLASGPGVDGLHPIQRAFWQQGGFQCGICTRGFIMSTYALLKANPNPTDDQIAEGLSGNICRCGEYAKIFDAVRTAAADLRGEQVTYTAPWTVLQVPTTGAAAAGNVQGVTKQFQFVTPLNTIEEFEPMAAPIKQRDGILEVSGDVLTITVKWDPAKLDEAKVRQILSDAGHPVKP
jgi:aerobic-type carbon monoxide dehydrogenase small subunit (CoxS/CutS family)